MSLRFRVQYPVQPLTSMSPSADFQEGQLSVIGESMCMNHLGGLSLPRKTVVRLTDRLDMTIDIYIKQQLNNNITAVI